METEAFLKNETTLSYSLPISLLRQYCFCPRIPYYLELLQIKPSAPLWVQQGGEFHVTMENLLPRRTLHQFGLEGAEIRKNFNVKSERLRIHGILDFLLIADNAVVPLEIKTGSGSPTRGQVMQLAAYGFAAEEMLNKLFSFGFLINGKKGKNYRIERTSELEKDVEITIYNLNRDLHAMLLPESAAKASQCAQCEFISFCNDRDLE